MHSRFMRTVYGIAAALFGVLALAILYIALFGWNWLRSPMEHMVKDKTGRLLTIQGNMVVGLSWPTVRLQAEQVAFANPSWARAPLMVSADGIEVNVDVPALLRRKLIFPHVTLHQANIFLEQSVDARKSWLLDMDQRDENARFQIGRLALNRGALEYLDEAQKTHIHAELSTARQLVKIGTASDLHFSAGGQYKGLTIHANGSGDPVMALRDATEPYSLFLDASVGKTTIQLKGSVTGLLTISAADFNMNLRGSSLEDLYPLLGIPFPSTRSYETQGHLIRQDNTWRYQRFSGRIGASDLSGFVQVITGGPRPVLSAELQSELLDLDDLGLLIGSRASVLPKLNAAPRVNQRMLPELPFNAERWGSVDADVTLRAVRLRRSMAWPLDKLESRLLLRDSVLTLDPFHFRLAGGQLSTQITLDGRSQPIRAHVQLRARKVLLAKLFPTFGLGNSSIGQVNGDLDLVGSGNSVGTMLANASGKIAFVITSGQVSKMMMEKAGLHLWEIFSLTLTGDRLVKLRCAVANFDVNHGVMHTKALVLDTEVTTLMGAGSVDLQQEKIDLALIPKTKITSPIALSSPIYIHGSFIQPQISIDKGRVVARAVGAIALAAINPVLTLVPLIDAGPGLDSDCKKLVREAKSVSNTKRKSPS